MANSTETPVAEPVIETPVEKEQVPETESRTSEDKPAELEVNGNCPREEKNDTDDADETKKEGNGHGEETEKEESTLKRKDPPTEVEDSPKKKKLVDADEKEPDTIVEA